MSRKVKHVFVFVVVWPTRESFGMARGPRFWALGIDPGPRGGAFEGMLNPQQIITNIFFIGAQTDLESISRADFL